MNKITIEDFPELWEDIVEDFETLGEMDHRRGATFYVNPQYIINENIAPNFPSLWGRWESETLTWSDDWGLDSDPTELHRLEQKEIVIKKTEWVRVK